MLDATAVSERRACRLAGLSRDAFRHPPEQAPATQALSARIIELAQVRRSSAIAACTTCCVRSTRGNPPAFSGQQKWS